MDHCPKTPELRIEAEPQSDHNDLSTLNLADQLEQTVRAYDRAHDDEIKQLQKQDLRRKQTIKRIRRQRNKAKAKLAYIRLKKKDQKTKVAKKIEKIKEVFIQAQADQEIYLKDLVAKDKAKKISNLESRLARSEDLRIQVETKLEESEKYRSDSKLQFIRFEVEAHNRIMYLEARLRESEKDKAQVQAKLDDYERLRGKIETQLKAESESSANVCKALTCAQEVMIQALNILNKNEVPSTHAQDTTPPSEAGPSQWQSGPSQTDENERKIKSDSKIPTNQPAPRKRGRPPGNKSTKKCRQED